MNQRSNLQFKVRNKRTGEIKQSVNYMIDGYGYLYWQFGFNAPEPLSMDEYEVIPI